MRNIPFGRPDIIAGVAGVLMVAVIASPLAVNLYENIAFALAPSAARAALYGERHFDAQHPLVYNVDRADYFYKEAAKLDPAYPYVNHQLARIAFLHGNFNTALFYINTEIQLHGSTEANTYYIRGLIEGYMGRYDDAANDYAIFLKADPNNWAGMNDYAWVLLKAKRFTEAKEVTARGLSRFPDNPWLLNSSAIALYELGEYGPALASAKKAVAAGKQLTPAQWLHAYPGNDPGIAQSGIAAFRTSAEANMHSIEEKIATSTVQS